jgi:membrane-bound lytic murein transglycosylase A
LRPYAVVVAMLAFAGCQTVPTPTPAPPAPVVPAPQIPRASFAPVDWTAVPGWSGDAIEAAWPAFIIGCRALQANARTQPLWQTPCTAAANVDGRNARAVRTFFESHFSPYGIAAADDGGTAGLVTGYYEPLLAGSRTRTQKYSVPLYAPPDDF